MTSYSVAFDPRHTPLCPCHRKPARYVRGAMVCAHGSGIVVKDRVSVHTYASSAASVIDSTAHGQSLGSYIGDTGRDDRIRWLHAKSRTRTEKRCADIDRLVDGFCTRTKLRYLARTAKNIIALWEKKREPNEYKQKRPAAAAAIVLASRRRRNVSCVPAKLVCYFVHLSNEQVCNYVKEMLRVLRSFGVPSLPEMGANACLQWAGVFARVADGDDLFCDDGVAFAVLKGLKAAIAHDEECLARSPNAVSLALIWLTSYCVRGTGVAPSAAEVLASPSTCRGTIVRMLAFPRLTEALRILCGDNTKRFNDLVDDPVKTFARVSKLRHPRATPGDARKTSTDVFSLHCAHRRSPPSPKKKS